MPKAALTLLLFALLAAACDNDGGDATATSQAPDPVEAEAQEAQEPEQPAAEPPLAAFPRNDWECTEESAEKIGEWLARRGEMNAQHAPIVKPANLQLPERAGEVLSGDFRPTIALEERRLSIDGRPVSADFYGDLESLSRPIRREVERTQALAAAEAQLMNEEAAPALPLFLLDQSVPKMGLETAFQALSEAGLEEVILVFQNPAVDKSAEAIPEELHRELTDLHIYSRELVAEAFQEAIADCPPISAAFDEMETLSPEERMPRLRQTLPQAWIDCQCQGNLEFAVAALVWPAEEGFPATTHKVSIADILAKLEDHEFVRWGELW